MAGSESVLNLKEAGIPVLDISPISLDTPSPALQDYQQVAAKLGHAFQNIGFIYLSHHGIPASVITGAMESSLQFFRLPDQHKEAVRKGKEYQGWVEQGREIFDQDEEGNIAELEIRETFDMKNISESGIFPDVSCPHLRKNLTNLGEHCTALALRLLQAVSLSLEQPATWLADMHRGMLAAGSSDCVENATTLRSLHYPPIPARLARQAGITRCGEHSDYGTLTLLFQDSLGGLEVRGPGRAWLPAPPLPGAVLLNVGDLLEAMSGGSYPATRHRVTVPAAELKRNSLRQSIVFFIHPDDSVVCEPVAGPDPQYPPITAIQHLLNRFSATYGDRLK